jgi:hypothetical protein
VSGGYETSPHTQLAATGISSGGRNVFGPNWQREYLRQYPAAYPREDFEARSELYILRSKVYDSALFSTNSKFREILIQHAASLVNT